jgi:hypothetical protein
MGSRQACSPRARLDNALPSSSWWVSRSAALGTLYLCCASCRSSAGDAPTGRLVAAAASATAELSLESRHLELLHRAERAIATNQPAVALMLLCELDERHPGGASDERRVVARLMAGCMEEAAGARSEARRFLEARPGNDYSRRVRSSCGFDAEL